MIRYTVKYKKIGDLFWKTLKNVKGDGLVEHSKARFFILDNESRVEISIEGVVFLFSKERFFAIKDNMEQSARQPIKTING